MNKQYKCIWNRHLCVWIAVSEITKSKNKAKSSLRIATGILILSASLMNTQSFAGSVNVCTGSGTSTGPSSAANYSFGCTTNIGIGAYESNLNNFTGNTASLGIGMDKTGSATGKIYLYAPSGTTIDSTVTVTGAATLQNGASLNNTKISNLANGTVSAASKDGINGSQLFSANQNIATALGGGSSVDASGNLTQPSYSVGGTTVTNVGAAVSNLDGRITTNTNNIATNSTAITNLSTALSQGAFSVSANGTGATKVAQNAVIDYSNKDNNLKISQTGTNFIFDLADQLNVKTGVTVGNAALSTTGLMISGGPSITTSGINAANTKLTNLSAGTVSAASTEGINGSQLYNANQNIATALGGGSSVDGNGNLTAPSYSVGGTPVNNVGAAVSNLDGRTTTNSTAITNLSTALSQGAFSVSANGTGATKVAQNAVIDYSNKDNNLKISQTGTNFIFDLADQLNVKTGVTVGNAVLSTTGLMISGGPSITTSGINAANTKLTNLTAGTVSAASTEGINGSQLFSANQNIATALGGGSSVDGNGNLTAPSYSVGGTPVNNVGAAVSNLDGRTTSNTNNIATNSTAITNLSTALSQGAFSVSANGTGATKVAQNAVIDYSNKDNNLKISQTGTNFIFDLADQLNVKTGVTVGNAALSTTGLMISAGPSITTSGINAANTKLTNLTAGTVSAASTEGINGSQLYNANQNIATALGGGSSVDASGNLTQPSYSVGGTPVNNVGAAVSNLDGRTTSNTNNIATNSTAITNLSTALSQGAFSVSANGIGATKVAQNAVIDYSNKDNNLKISQTGTNFIFDLADQLNVKTGVTVGNAALSTTGLMISSGPSITTSGINAANTKITNLTAGTVSAASTEGINGSQLFSANQNIASALGGGSSVDASGNLTAPSYSVGGTSVNNVGAAVSNLDGRTTTNSNNIATNSTAITNLSTALSQGAFSVSANGTGATKVAQNSVIDYSNKDNNLKISQTGTNFIFDLADQLNVKTGVTVGNAALSSTGLMISGGPSITTTGFNAANTKLTNLTAGTVSAASTEGINGSQLFSANQNIASALGGGSTVDSNGNLTQPSYSVGGTTVNNVGAAVTNLDGRTTTNSTAITNLSTALSQGAFSVSANGTGATKVAQNAVIDYSNKDNNLKISQTGTNFIFDLADQLNVKTGVTVGNAALSTTGLMISAGPSITTSGINAANTKITNLTAGTVSAASTEGINGSQLYNANQNIASALGGGSTVDSNGNLTAPSYSVGGTTVNNVGAAISSVDGRLNTIQTNVNNIVTNSTDAITYARNATGQIDRTKVNLAGVQSRIVQDKYNNNVVANGGTLITNVANAVNAADAVNKGQLDSTLSNAKDYTDQQVSAVTGGLNLNLTEVKAGVSNLQNGRDGMFQVNPTGTIVMPTPVGENALAGGNAAQARGKNATAVGNKAVASADQTLALGNQSTASADSSVALGYNAIASVKNAVALGTDTVADRENTVSVGNDQIQRQITHVAAGTANTDAVNVQQLNQASNRIGGKVEQLNQQIQQLNQHVIQVDRRANAAIAGVSAMANIPQAMVGGQRSIGIGVGHHRGQNAVAIGASMAVDSGKWVIKGSAAFNSQDKSTYGAGLSRVW